jgi:hypothetical protein
VQDENRARNRGTVTSTGAEQLYSLLSHLTVTARNVLIPAPSACGDYPRPSPSGRSVEGLANGRNRPGRRKASVRREPNTERGIVMNEPLSLDTGVAREDVYPGPAPPIASMKNHAMRLVSRQVSVGLRV